MIKIRKISMKGNYIRNTFEENDENMKNLSMKFLLDSKQSDVSDIFGNDTLSMIEYQITKIQIIFHNKSYIEQVNSYHKFIVEWMNERITILHLLGG
jgi:hypothetical protein